jgi:hypothetical protein
MLKLNADCRKDAFVIGLRDWLRDQGLDIRSLRHLGAGGTGLATLFEVRSSRSRVRKKFVVKSSRRANDPLLQYEKSIQMVCILGAASCGTILSSLVLTLVALYEESQTRTAHCTNSPVGG